MAKKGSHSELSAVAEGPRSVAGLFRDPFTAADLICSLTAAGFSKDDISVAVASNNADGASDGQWTRATTEMFSDSNSLAPAEMGLDPANADYLERGVRSGYILVAIQAGQRAAEVATLLRLFGADLGERGQLLLLDDRELRRLGDRRIEVFGSGARKHEEKKAA
jgi:hypothetical protein